MTGRQLPSPVGEFYWAPRTLKDMPARRAIAQSVVKIVHDTMVDEGPSIVDIGYNLWKAHEEDRIELHTQ